MEIETKRKYYCVVVNGSICWGRVYVRLSSAKTFLEDLSNTYPDWEFKIAEIRLFEHGRW